MCCGSFKVKKPLKTCAKNFGAYFIECLSLSRLRRPVRCAVERFDDMALSGGRHPFLGKYKIAYSKDGKLNAYHVDMYDNGGYSTDASVFVSQRL